ncbi:DUF389 domain-containing protein [Luteimicrobium subarcticum]|uniref:Putative hydrophobic protein (TIGR00271 family) n=1 Tax=Luteimicrobium subarcticum TaxID=620910 RepID=A0A2M8W742_9MICO|nr:DUF389 domain-containing protein [Luteimicrobium subarcticum]PJI86751.1 putative hydrophobic protein (TIGR00271 family) [Luteimicrobium subarcticum]
MIHLRLVVSADLSPRVVGLLRDDDATTDVVLVAGAAQQPEGDLVLADVTREAASAVIDRLVDLGVPDDGSISAQEVDTVVSAAADRAEQAAPGAPSDAVVWQELQKRAGSETRPSVTFCVLMAVACVIGMIGVLTNQPVLVVGAMAVGPDFGPLAALALGVVRRSREMLLGGLRATVLGYGCGVAGAAVGALLLRWWGLLDPADLVAKHAITDFVYHPGGLSWVVAFLAGVAGAVSLATERTGALVGVLISVTTIPAAGVLGASLAFGVGDEAWGAAVQLAVNVVMIVAGSLTALGVQALSQRTGRRGDAPRGAARRAA